MTRLLLWVAAVGSLLVVASLTALAAAAIVEAITEWWAERRGTDEGDPLDWLRED